ncbi:hypothetical protein ACFFRR_000147 [Megaselia abdita]
MNNTAMGLQGSAATKRKHEITLDSKSSNAYTTLNCPPPTKTGRWSTTGKEQLEISTNNNNDSQQKNNEDVTTENSIAKLEVACESWTATVTETSTVVSQEPVVDCISKLQAVAVPSDPWGSISTRSTLATTLLSADELDDDDDDFDDDYEEDESIIPTYCPITRYHPCAPRNNFQNGYNTRPNYYSEPFPQQNCSRTGSQPHLRPSNGFHHWNGGGGNVASSNTSSFYESNYQPPQSNQQTIRCAENGKSYLDLGCSNSFNTPSAQTNSQQSRLMDTRHPSAVIVNGVGTMKRCCDGRNGTWCNTNKGCYRDTRLRIRNLSMFKLSRFRQVSEQSLYRSVLICNTLKYIDREIESEAKEIQQQQQYHQQQQHHQYLSHQHSLQNMHLQHHQMQHHNHHGDYIPSYHQQQQQQPTQQPPQQQQPPNHQFHMNGDCSHNSYSQMNVLKQQQQPTQYQQQQQQPQNNTSIHPYDHYPFRENNSGRVTPFPATSTINDNDSSYSSEDDSNRSINWSSVLSLSSQSALDPLNNNDLFPILQTPPAVVTTSQSSTTTQASSTSTSTSCDNTTATLTTVTPSSTVAVASTSSSGVDSITTISQLSKTITSLTSSATTTSSASVASSAWEYNFLDMDFGLGSEFTELVPTCKSTDDIFKNSSSVVTTMNHRYESELEHPAHIMVGS